MDNFLTRISDCDSHSPALLDLFISSDPSVCSPVTFPALGNSDDTVISDSIDFSSNSKRWCLFSLHSLWQFSRCFVFYLGFLWRTFTIHRQQGKGEGIFLTPLYHFQPLHRHLDISQAITTESSPLHRASSRTRTGSFCFPGASR